MADKIRNAMGEVSSPTTDHMASSTDGASGGRPPRKEPVFKEKPERKLPVFADEFRPQSDDEDVEVSAFTTDAIATPFAMSPVVQMETSEPVDDIDDSAEEPKAKKRKNKNKASKNELDDSVSVASTAQEQSDELAAMGGTMPVIGAMGVDTYLDLANAMSAPYGVTLTAADDGLIDVTW